jgi:AraC-like DNA-binding protein
MYAYKSPTSSSFSVSSPTTSLRASHTTNRAVVRQLVARQQPDQCPNKAFLAIIDAEIERQLDNADLGIQELMKAVHLSHSQLFRRLKAISGMAPTAYIRNVRLQKANQLLISTDWRVSEIAYSIGFTDPNYFSRAFRKKFGCTPGVVRNNG